MSVLQRVLLVLALIAVSAVAFRPALIERPLDNRVLASSDVLLLKTNELRSFSIDTTSVAVYYWDVPTVPVPMRVEVTPDNTDAYMICYNPEVGDYDQSAYGVCQDVDAGGFGVVKLSATLLRKWHGKNLRIYVLKSTTNPSSDTMTSTIVIKRDNQKAVAIGVGVGVGGAALLGAVACGIMKFKKSKASKDNAKDEKKEKKDKKDKKDDKDEKEDKEKKEKKNRKNSQDDSDQEPETSTPHKCEKCKCHKGLSNEHLTNKELEYYFPSNRFDSFHSSLLQPSCSVCSVNFQPETPCRQFYCGHIFHTSCIDNEVRKNNKCPSCSSALTREAIQSLLVYRSNEQRRGNPGNENQGVNHTVARDNGVHRPEDLLIGLKQQQYLQQQNLQELENQIRNVEKQNVAEKQHN